MRISLLILCTIKFCAISLAQGVKFSSDIAAFKKSDSMHHPLKNEILFVGSSTFTKWHDVQNYFPQHKIINRGFGGSTIVDVIRYAGDIIYPYEPKQVVIYCGDNDIALSDTVTTNTVIYRFQLLFGIIRQVLPNTTIDYISIKYSPSRKKYWSKIAKVNAAIQQFLAHQKKAAFIDISKVMQNKKGQIDTTLYTNDMLHMNELGYKKWEKVIEPYLE